MAKAMGFVLTARWAVRWLAFVVMDAIEKLSPLVAFAASGVFTGSIPKT